MWLQSKTFDGIDRIHKVMAVFVEPIEYFSWRLSKRGIHAHILRGGSHLPGSSEMSLVPAQHIMHPASQGFVAGTGYLAVCPLYT